MKNIPYPNTKKNKFKAIIIGFSVILLLIVAYFNQNLLYVTYAYLFKMDSFNKGDKVYTVQHAGFHLSRLIRPITQNDIDTMQVSDTEKLRLQLSLDNSLKPYAIDVERYASAKGKTNYIGTYLEHRFLWTLADNKKRVLSNMIAVKVSEKFPLYEGYSDNEALPKGYTWADGNYYLYIEYVTNKETFKASESQKKN